MQIVNIICDVCQKDYTADIFELQEFVHISYTGGYGSVFGDGDTMKLDICQHCLKQKLGEWIRVDNET